MSWPYSKIVAHGAAARLRRRTAGAIRVGASMGSRAWSSRMPEGRLACDIHDETPSAPRPAAAAFRTELLEMSRFDGEKQQDSEIRRMPRDLHGTGLWAKVEISRRKAMNGTGDTVSRRRKNSGGRDDGAAAVGVSSTSWSRKAAAPGLPRATLWTRYRRVAGHDETP